MFRVGVGQPMWRTPWKARSQVEVKRGFPWLTVSVRLYQRSDVCGEFPGNFQDCAGTSPRRGGKTSFEGRKECQETGSRPGPCSVQIRP